MMVAEMAAAAAVAVVKVVLVVLAVSVLEGHLDSIYAHLRELMMQLL